jgi:hypothetical protein
MNKLENYFAALTNTKPKGQLVILVAENDLCMLKISELNKVIENYNESIKITDIDNVKNHLELNIKELELRVMELNTKINLNNIMITRINIALNNSC